jgi:DNA-binding MarR family transcriptional regulator
MHLHGLQQHILRVEMLTTSGIVARTMNTGQPINTHAAAAPRVAAVGADELADRWHTLMDHHARTTGALERALGPHGLGVSEYEVLERLAALEVSDCRMQLLADLVPLSQSALSRVVGRLEDQGLVVRAMCSDDRRGIQAQLTDTGRQRYEEARPAHRAVLAEMLGG